MRITRRPPTGVQGSADVGQVGEPSVGQVDRPRAGQDRVELSEAARLRQRLRAEIGDVIQIGSGTVAALRERVATGTYNPDPVHVARRMMADLAADLLA